MMNNLLSVIVVGGLVGTFVLAPMPESEPRSVASRPTPSAQPAAVAPAIAVANLLRPQQPPIPLVRSHRPVSATATSPGVPANQAEAQPQDRSDRTAAQVAIEADGYKSVTVLGKATDGTWRAKAYRGKTEVQLTVDGTGRVSTE